MMNDLGFVIKKCSNYEQFFEKVLNSFGRGLHEKINNVEKLLDPEIVKKFRLIATIRNKVVHEPDYDFENNKDIFCKVCEELDEYIRVEARNNSTICGIGCNDGNGPTDQEEVQIFRAEAQRYYHYKNYIRKLKEDKLQDPEQIRIRQAESAVNKFLEPYKEEISFKGSSWDVAVKGLEIFFDRNRVCKHCYYISGIKPVGSRCPLCHKEEMTDNPEKIWKIVDKYSPYPKNKNKDFIKIFLIALYLTMKQIFWITISICSFFGNIILKFFFKGRKKRTNFDELD